MSEPERSALEQRQDASLLLGGLVNGAGFVPLFARTGLSARPQHLGYMAFLLPNKTKPPGTTPDETCLLGLYRF